MAIQIESRVLGDLAKNHVIPTAIRYQNTLIDNVRGLKDVLPKAAYEGAAKEQLDMITEISSRVSKIKSNVDAMVDARRKANVIEDARDLAISYDETVKPFFETIRYEVDKLEILIDDELWPLPKYREMLFTR